jgi:hypothetical protein
MPAKKTHKEKTPSIWEGIVVSIVTGTVLAILLFIMVAISKNVLLNPTIDCIQNIRNTIHYEGETRAIERFNILIRYILPSLWILSVAITSITRLALGKLTSG